MQNFFRKNSFFLYVIVGFISFTFFAQKVFADTSSGSATVSGSVAAVCGNNLIEGAEACDDGNTTNGDGCSSVCAVENDNQNNGGGAPQGGGGGGDAQKPIIANVTASTTVSVADVTWTATDDTSVESCTIQYDIDASYSKVGNVVIQDGKYTARLENLLSNTKYLIQIRCVDPSNNQGQYQGDFTTKVLAEDDLAPPLIENVAVHNDVLGIWVDWKATDASGIDQCSFVFDTDEAAEPYDHEIQVEKRPQPNLYRATFQDLIPNVVHFFKITCLDNAGKNAVALGNFTPPKDNVPPPDVANINAVFLAPNVKLFWDFNANDVKDFSKIVIRRSLAPIGGINDGELLTEIVDPTKKEFLDGNVIEGKKYFYKIFVVDTSENVSNGVSVSIQVPGAAVVPPEICNNGKDDDGDGKVDCADNECGALPACINNPPPPGGNEGAPDGNGGNQGGNQGGGPAQGGGNAGQNVGGEICDNGKDDDQNGQVDCADNACADLAACQVREKENICDDQEDNDSDGLIDFADPDCIIKAIPSGAPVNGLQLQDLLFWLSQRTIPVEPQNGTIHSLVGRQITVGVEESKLQGDVDFIMLVLRGNNYELKKANDGIYYSDFFAPIPGTYTAEVVIKYKDLPAEKISFFLEVLPNGSVVDRESKEPLEELELTLFRVDNGEKVWQGTNYKQTNPIQLKINEYGFIVPNGTYRVVIKSNGYVEYKSLLLKVENNVINRDFTLIKKASDILDGVDFDAPLGETITKIFDNLQGKIKEQGQILSQKALETAEKLQELADDKQVEEVTKKVVAPATIGVSAAVVVPSLWSSLIPLLRFLFLQPLLLFGRGKRKEWGMVYNSFTKLAIDLAIVRLVDVHTKKVVQSRVTDAKGRYMFFVKPGSYLLEVTKQGFTFPSNILRLVKSDGRLLDIYHGEPIEVTAAQVAITPNVPVDPVGETKTPKRIRKEKHLRIFQNGLSSLGIFVTGVSFYVSPTWYIGAFFILQLALYVLFAKYLKPKKPKGWGIVYDKKTRKPVHDAIIRLFTKEYNKLVSTQITDKKGRYAFLVGPSNYYYTVESKHHSEYKSDDIDLGESEENYTVIKDKVPLLRKHKGNHNSPAGQGSELSLAGDHLHHHKKKRRKRSIWSKLFGKKKRHK